MARLKFKDILWDELCPIYVETHNNFEKIATGVLLNIYDNVFLLTASHVIDQAKNINKEIAIPTKYGLENISGTLYHRYLQENENRDDDMLDLSWYKLAPKMIDILHEDFIPLTEEKIEILDSFTFQYDKSIEPIPVKDMMKRMKFLYDNPNPENSEKLEYINNFTIKTRITFAGYPNTKSKFRETYHSGEQVYYHGSRVDEDTYKLYNCMPSDNIIASYGKKGTMNTDFDATNFPKPKGISGGGIYRLIETKDGLDRKLIGIGHTYKDKAHLFIGTNISFCLDVILRRLEREKTQGN
jgi:hypothetical protein